MTIIERYKAEKAAHPDELVLLRLGDFYEAFEDDAVKLAAFLDRGTKHMPSGRKYRNSLTKRNGVLMAGVPAHAIDKYVADLTLAGHRVFLSEENSGLGRPQ